MKTFLILFCLLLAITPRLRCADDPPAEVGPLNILIDLQIVTVPRNIGLPLVRELKSEALIERAYARLQELLDHGTAKLVGWPMVMTQSGQTAFVKGGEELLYAEGFQPGGTAIYIAKAPGGNDSPVAGQGPVMRAPAATDGTEFKPVITNLVERDTGIDLEVEPAFSEEGKSIDMTITLRHVKLKKMARIAVENKQTQDRIVAEQPEFETMRTTAPITIKSGERMLLGVFATSEPEDSLELFLLHAEFR